MRVSNIFLLFVLFFFFKQKTAYEMRISDWSSDVCSSDLDQRQQQRPSERGDHPLLVDLALAHVAADQQPIVAGQGEGDGAGGMARVVLDMGEIGRASCRERVCQYV